MGEGRRWQPGDVILWRYQRDAVPVRVVRDDADGLVAWLAPGTPRLAGVPVAGGGVRDLPLAERFTAPRRYELTTWEGTGILRVERPGRSHSLWRFPTGWYANLEDPLRRTDDGVQTRDHILDVWLDDGGFWLWKDEDELATCVEIGRVTERDAAAARTEGERVIAAFGRGDAPFDGAWRDWRPDPTWTVPTLPAEVAALDGQPAPPVS